MCVCESECGITVGRSYLLIVAILQDTKLGVVMSAVMSSCQGNRSMPLAQRSDRWDGTDLCELGQDKAASLSFSPSSSLSRSLLCRSLRSYLSFSHPFVHAVVSFFFSMWLHRWRLHPSCPLLSLSLLCLPHFHLHPSLSLSYTHTQVLIMSDVSE